MLSEEEAIKILKEMKDDLQEDANCAEDWVNTGADEEKIDAINAVLNLVEKLKNAVVKRDIEIIDMEETAEKEFLTKQEVKENYIPKERIEQEIKDINKLIEEDKPLQNLEKEFRQVHYATRILNDLLKEEE